LIFLQNKINYYKKYKFIENNTILFRI